MKKSMSIISACALCAITLLAASCEHVEYDNPLDHKGNDYQPPIIKFDANGGSVNRSYAQVDTAGKVSVIPTSDRTGYTFNGWFTETTGGTQITPNTVFYASDTVYARWTPITYTITYNLNGGTIPAASAQYAEYSIISPTIPLPIATRGGYTFVGWYDNVGLTGTPVSSIPAGSTGDKAYWAKWIPIYTITFNTDGGTPAAIEPVSVDSGTTMGAKFPDAPTKTGYIFGGWFDGDTQYIATTAITKYLSLIAKWTLDTYTITYDLDGGAVSIDNPINYYVTTPDITLTNPTKTGYTFAGWTGTDIITPVKTMIIPAGSTGDKSYTAHWTLITYTITFDATGGEVTAASGMTGVGGVLASLPTPRRYGHGFNGWYTATTNGMHITTSTSFTANTTIYAQWTKYCENFIEETEREHYGANKKQFCDERDGQKYVYVTIDNQTWMAENLNYNTLDGSGSWCYNYANSNCEIYGRLYNWSTAMAGASSSSLTPSGVSGVCPSGWHLPSDAEWSALIDVVGGSNIAGKKLKANSGYWITVYGSTTSYDDDFGFSALPGGSRSEQHHFNSIGDNGFWWSATEHDAADAQNWVMNHKYNDGYSNWHSKMNGFSVRCLRDYAP